MPVKPQKPDDAFADGMDAYHMGRDKASNPFDPDQNEEDFWDWMEGWEEGKRLSDE